MTVPRPRWPAYLMAAGAAACAHPAITTPAPGQAERYTARGQEPGWLVEIAGGRILYSGNYGDKRISVARPDPRPSINGRRYETRRLTVDITYVRCNDAMSGHGYEHEVRVSADGETYNGCGGTRRPDWNM